MRTGLATPADVPAIAAIYNHAIVHTIASFWTETRPETEIAEQLAEGGARYRWLVADADGQVLGVAWSKRWNPRQAYDLTCEVSIYIAPNAQGRGIGKLLYTDVFSRLAEIGYEHVLAGISLPNDASVRLHESMGMWHVGTYRGVNPRLAAATASAASAAPALAEALGAGCDRTPFENAPRPGRIPPADRTGTWEPPSISPL